MVRIHAQRIVLATPQWTALKRCTVPTPMMPPAMVWVVETGMPAMAVPRMLVAAAVSAQNPPKGLSLVIRIPMVLTILQPPNSVPNAMAVLAMNMT